MQGPCLARVPLADRVDCIVVAETAVVADRVAHTVAAGPVEDMVVAGPVENMVVSHTVVDQNSYTVVADVGLACL